jgi:hypothetical protein
VDHKTISNDLGKNCSFAKIPQDLGEQWNEQGEIGERLGVAQQTVSDMDTENCNLAKIGKDLGEQWNEQVSLDTNNCNLAKICNHPSPRAWACRNARSRQLALTGFFPARVGAPVAFLQDCNSATFLPARVGVPQNSC